MPNNKENHQEKESWKKEFCSITDWPDKGAMADYWLSKIHQAQEEARRDVINRMKEIREERENHLADDVIRYYEEEFNLNK